MTQTLRDKYEHKREKIQWAAGLEAPPDGYDSRANTDSGEVIDTRDGELILSFLDCKDDIAFKTDPTGDSSKSTSTLKNYADALRVAARRIDGTLRDATPADINSLMESYLRGSHPDVKDSGLSKRTVCHNQSALRKFYEWLNATDEYSVSFDKEQIHMVRPTGKTVDEDDMFTMEEVQQMRDATQTYRESALLDIMLYTGQRIRAIQTLRIKDVDVEAGASGKLYLRDGIDGLKGAAGGRPLLGAQASIRRYLNHHPCADDPDAALFTGYPEWVKDDVLGEHLSTQAMNRDLKKIRERTDVTKPVNPHNFRHFFVTIAKKQYDLDNEYIKKLTGHSPNSRVMETTYQHLTADDAGQKIEEAMGIRDIEEASSLSPPTCPTCNEALPDNAKACANCGATFTPDAKSIEDEINDATYDTLRDADDESVKEAVDKFRELLDDPEIRAAVLEDVAED